MFKEGVITIPSNHKAAKGLVEGLTQYAYRNVKLDYEKISRRVKYRPGNKSDSEYEDFDVKFKSGNDDCRYSYVVAREFDDRYYDEKQPDVIDVFRQIHEYVIENGARSVKIDKCKRLEVINKSGVNSDTRGIRGLDWVLKFYPTFVVERRKGITLHDVIISCYKTKSHKFENNYECMWAIEDFRFKKGVLSIELDLDHGS